jgi:hypothetical protein
MGYKSHSSSHLPDENSEEKESEVILGDVNWDLLRPVMFILE